MKKLEKRAFLCLLMAAVLLAGLVFFVVRLELNGAKWSAFYANRHVYTNGALRVGSVSDRNGKLLLQNDKDGAHYSDDSSIRRATYHVVGDLGGNVATAANTAFRRRQGSFFPSPRRPKTGSRYFQPAWFPSSPHKSGRFRSVGFCRCHAQMSSSA